MTFGAMNFGDYDFQGFKSNVNQSLANDLVAMALDSGINFFDTADMYAAGQSEEMLGKALGKKRSNVVISTKAFFRTGPDIIHAGLSYRHIMDSCIASLKRLNTDFIDLFLLHAYDTVTPLEETTRVLEDLQRRGMVRYTGYCNLSAWHAEKILGIQARLGFRPMITAQVHYSLLTRDIEFSTVPHAREAGLGIMIWSPTSSGFLTGKYTREDMSGGGGRRSTFDFPPIDKDKGFEVVGLLKKIAEKHNATPAQVAIAWILSKPFVSTVLMGATKLDHLKDNMKAEQLVLEKEDITELDEMTVPKTPYPEWMLWGDPATQNAISEGWVPEK
jgi:aryl-alcohol dehydrogenase-like predicted oxidoreductase